MASGQCSGFIDWSKDSRPLIQRKKHIGQQACIDQIADTRNQLFAA